MMRLELMKARENAFSFSRAPTGRGRCRGCKRVVGKGELRIVTLACVSSWPMPRRSTSFVRHVGCVNSAFAAAVLKVHGKVDKVPVVGEMTEDELGRARGALEKAV